MNNSEKFMYSAKILEPMARHVILSGRVDYMQSPTEFFAMEWNEEISPALHRQLIPEIIKQLAARAK